jgi:hypothetical protein
MTIAALLLIAQTYTNVDPQTHKRDPHVVAVVETPPHRTPSAQEMAGVASRQYVYYPTYDGPHSYVVEDHSEPPRHRAEPAENDFSGYYAAQPLYPAYQPYWPYVAPYVYGGTYVHPWRLRQPPADQRGPRRR